MVHSMHLPQLDLYELFHTTRRSIQFPAHLWKKNTPSDWWHSRYISDSYCATQNDPGIVYRPQNVLTVDNCLQSINKQCVAKQKGWSQKLTLAFAGLVFP